MTVKESLETYLEVLPEERLRELLHFAEFLKWQQERSEWQQFGRTQFARAYGKDEPEYTMVDVKRVATP